MAERAATLPGRLRALAEERAASVALREKKLGIWQETSWRSYLLAVARCARALAARGVGRGDHVAILSDNRPEWLYADLATQVLGARSVGIYQTNPPADIEYILRDCGARILVCENQEQVDKLAHIDEPLPELVAIAVLDPRGTRHVGDPRLVAYDDLVTSTDPEEELIRWYDERLDELDADAPAMVVYTSGTTAAPKGAMLSSRNVTTLAEAMSAELNMSAHDTVLSYLPLCHVAEKLSSLFIPLTSAAIVHFGESIDTVQADLREVSPTVFLGVPRIWEKIHSAVMLRMADSSRIKRLLFDYFLTRRLRKKSQPASGMLAQLGSWLSDFLVFRSLRRHLGFARCRLALTGAAPISVELLTWFEAIGVNLCEGYGQTECAGVSHFNPPGAKRRGSVGRPLPCVECRISEEGEVLVRGDNVFCGYLGDGQTSDETVNSGGWLHTGDLGVVDDEAYLTIVGRKKEVIITSGGKNLSPEKIESALKTSPFIKEVIAIGDNRKFVAALILAEPDAVADWATRRGLPFTSYADLCSKKELIDLIDREVERANATLARVETVRAFHLLDKELTEEDGEVTATQKVKRRVVAERYSNEIDRMYGGERE